jgi:hypothetical protein
MIKDEWWPCTELTLQGNLTIAGFAQKTWTAKPNVCEIHLHGKSGMARIDWNHSSVVVSPAVIQHATLNYNGIWENERRATGSLPNLPSEPTTATPSGLETPAAKPLEDPNVAKPSRADEILAELDPPAPTGFRRRMPRKPKAD